MDSPSLKTHTYEKKSLVKTTMQDMLDFHSSPKALPKLTPPPLFVQINSEWIKSLTEGDLQFTLWFGFIPIRWHARHEAGPIPTSFADLMVAGPMGYWRHEHIFEEAEGGIMLTDRVTLGHKNGIQGLLTRLMFDGIPLRFLFFYRHMQTKRFLHKVA